jgi:predicted GNAT family N-acyltransferase
MMEVRIISAEQTRELRHLVLWPHLERLEQCITDADFLPDTFHLGTFFQNRLVAIGTFFPQDPSRANFSGAYRLRAMASHPEVRGKGAGAALVKQGFIEIQKRGSRLLWCDARLKAVPFYASLGMQALPEIYEVPLIGPHQFMWKEL